MNMPGSRTIAFVMLSCSAVFADRGAAAGQDRAITVTGCVEKDAASIPRRWSIET